MIFRSLCALAFSAFNWNAAQAANSCLNPKINEFEPNPVGQDPTNVSIEIICADADKGNESSFSGWLVSVESDIGASQGTVDRATSVSGAFDANGLLVVSIPDLENPSFTFVLMEDFTGITGTTDIDTDNDGVVDDSSTFVNIYDAIGVPDTSDTGEPLYGSQLGGIDFPFTGASNGNEPRLVYRDGVDVDVFYVLQDPDGGVIKSVKNGSITDLSVSDFVGQNPLSSSFGSVNPSVSVTSPTPSPLPAVEKKIHEIQGSGVDSPIVGELVTVTAIVIG